MAKVVSIFINRLLVVGVSRSHVFQGTSSTIPDLKDVIVGKSTCISENMQHAALISVVIFS